MKIAVEGNIGASKSTVFQALHETFANTDVLLVQEPVDSDPEWHALMALAYAEPTTYSLAFATKVLLSHSATGRHTGHVVSERSPASTSAVFNAILHADGALSDNDMRLYTLLDQTLGWRPEYTIFISTPAEVCMSRVQARARDGEASVDLAYLRRIEMHYDRMLAALPADQKCIVDGTMPPDQVAEAVRNAILMKML